MSRRDIRRAWARDVRRAMRQAGCTCHPRQQPAPDDAPSWVQGAFRHEDHCRLLIRLADFHGQPAVIIPDQRCDR